MGFCRAAGADFDAGLERRGGAAKFASEAENWAHVRAQIVGLVRDKAEKPLGMELLGGENATDAGFLATLREALAELRPGGVCGAAECRCGHNRGPDVCGGRVRAAAAGGARW